MRKHLRSLLAALCLLSACKQDDCRDIECLSPVAEDHFSFRLLSATDTTDLMFGPNRRYNSDSLRLYSLRNADTFDHLVYSVPYLSAPPDSVLSATVNRGFERAFLRLSDGDVDTITLFYGTVNDGGCCGPYTRLDSVSYNGGAAILPQSDVLIFYK